MDSSEKARKPAFRDNGREGGRDRERNTGRDFGRERGRDSGRDAGRDPGREKGRDNGRAPRPERDTREGRFPRERAPFRHSGDRELHVLLDIDKEILRLLGRRATLLAALRHGDKLDPALEKKLRMAWEEGCLKASRNPRLARDMFALMQSLEPAPKEEGRGSFTLSPQIRPVEIDLDAPRSSTVARIGMMLAVASGRALELGHVTLSDPVVETVKACNQLGGELRWEEDGRVHCPAGKGLLRNVDKVVHTGNDFFTFALVLAFALGQPMRLKLTGGEDLRFAGLAGMGRFLPLLGARLTQVIPGQEGLPVRVECSGMLPEVVEIPAELPAPFVLALVCAAPFWGKNIVFEMGQDCRGRSEVLALLPELRRLGLKLEAEEGDLARIRVAPGCELPLSPELPQARLLNAYLLAMPVFAGGSVKLHGRNMGKDEELNALLAPTGLSITWNEDAALSELANGARPAQAESFNTGGRLYPLAVALAARQALTGKSPALPEAPDEGEAATALSFLAALGLEEGEGKTLRRGEASGAPWLSPSPAWAMAYALCAFARSGIRLANPFVMNALHPLFWNMYNSLPRPDFRKAAPVENSDDKPVRRRIIAQGVFGEMPPELPSDDDY